MDEKITGSFECFECGEIINWSVKKYVPKDSEDCGMVTYDINQICPKCRLMHVIEVDIDDSVNIWSTGKKISKRYNKTYVFVNKFKSKTKEELLDKVMEIFAKYIIR